MSTPKPLVLPDVEPPTRIVLDGNVRYLRLLQVLRAAGFDAAFEDSRGEVLRISERTHQ